ncbi:hypothetical protein ACFVKH_18660 [Almyronema epifaneia S1]|uniref:Uncharacterized protein n=1 Tax=Almyronema epifaneia S1 TaxID=2991925 RepID=A0ABW6ILY1_9CYAN
MVHFKVYGNSDRNRQTEAEWSTVSIARGAMLSYELLRRLCQL